MSNNSTNLNLIDKLVLLALDDEKGTFVSDSLVFGYCIAGAVLFELSVKNNIEIIDNTIKVINKQKLNDDSLDYCLELISESKKERKVDHWIELLGNKEDVLRKKVLNKLISLGILEEKESKILWVFTNRKYPTKNEIPEKTIRQGLNDIVVNNSAAEMDEIMMISLVDSSGLNEEVYGKEIAKKKHKEIKRIKKDFQFADETGQLIKELHDTIIAVLLIVITTTTLSTTTSS